MKLTEYITSNREEIIARVETSTSVLLPNSEDPPRFPSKRTPYDGQARVIEAARRTLADKKAVFVIGEMGTGKTLIGSLIPKPGTKIIILCPSHLIYKWKREIEETRPHATAWIVKSIADCQKALDTDPTGQDTHWYILSKETAKLSYLWKSAARIKQTNAWIFNRQLGCKELQSIDSAICPDCYSEITTTDSKGSEHLVDISALEKHKRYCPRCNAALWTADRSRNRKIAISDYLKKKHAKFDYLIIDEAHEYKAADSAQGNALGALSAISDRKIMLTGTLIGGYATHLYYLLWRVLPRVMKRLDFVYKSPRAFINSYGVRELVTREYISDGAHNRGSKGSSKNQTWNERPGISPRLFTDFLLSNGIYLQLDDLSANLPPLYEMPERIQMDSEQASSYRDLERKLRAALAPELARGNRRNLSKMLVNLLAWSDSPWDNTNIILGETASIKCPNISSTGPTAKERRLIEIAEEARERGSKTLIYCQFTASRDVQPRLQQILEQHGLKTAILRSTVKPEKREQWIIDNAPDTDCLICNPEIVKTGLDLYDYTTIVFFQTGYNTFTIRQASRRSWRLGQAQECRIYYLYYTDTMQHRAIELVAKKLNSATALDGKLSSEGLNAMADDDDAFILAKALMEGLSMDSQIQFGTPRPQDIPPAETPPAPAEISQPAADPQPDTHWITEPAPTTEPDEMTYTATLPAWTPTTEEIEFDLLSFFYANKRRTIDRESLFNFYVPRKQQTNPPSPKLRTSIIIALDEIIAQRGLIEYRNSGTTIALAKKDGTYIDRYHELKNPVHNYRVKLTQVYITSEIENATLNIDALYSDEINAALHDRLDIFLEALKALEAEKKIFLAPTKINSKNTFTREIIKTENFSSSELTLDRSALIPKNTAPAPTPCPRPVSFQADLFRIMDNGAFTHNYICEAMDTLKGRPLNDTYDNLQILAGRGLIIRKTIEQDNANSFFLYTLKDECFEPGDRYLFDQIIQLLTQRPETAGHIMQQLTGPGTMPYICRLLDQLEEEQRIVGFTDHDNEFRYQLRSRVIFNETPPAPVPNPQPEKQPENIKTLEHYRRLKQEAQAKRKTANRKSQAGQLTLFG